jgi:hypothetical protein
MKSPNQIVKNEEKEVQEGKRSEGVEFLKSIIITFLRMRFTPKKVKKEEPEIRPQYWVTFYHSSSNKQTRNCGGRRTNKKQRQQQQPNTKHKRSNIL